MYQSIVVDLEINLLLISILDVIICLMGMCLCIEYSVLLGSCMERR